MYEINIYNKHYIMQILWLLKEEKNFYNNYHNYYNYLDNHINYIESVYKFINILKKE